MKLKQVLKKAIISLCAVSVFLSTGLSNPLRADDAEPVIKLYAKASEGPIGLAQSSAPFSISGRETFGQEFIWSGELLRASIGGVRVSFAELGEAALSRGAMVTFARDARGAGNEEGEVLIAALAGGDVAIRLQAEARAYVEAGGAAFVASPGASFRISVRDGAATVAVSKGDVQQTQAQQRRYFIRPVGLGASLSVRARSTRQIQVQVTDENDRPVPDVPVIFTLGGSGGSFSAGATTAASTITVSTNAQGIATTAFTAGANPANTSLTATVSGSNASFTTQIQITPATGFFTPTNMAVLAAAAAAGAVTAVAVSSSGNGSRETIQALPPDIRPR